MTQRSRGGPTRRAGPRRSATSRRRSRRRPRGELAAIVTAPISKTWARRAGFAFPGHTEMLAARLGARDVVMMFAGPRLKVALATVHVPLAEVPRVLTTHGLRRTIELVAASLVRDFGIAAPRIGVVGLNPHAGEGGLLGDEDARRHRAGARPPLAPATLSARSSPTRRSATPCTVATTRWSRCITTRV